MSSVAERKLVFSKLLEELAIPPDKQANALLAFDVASRLAHNISEPELVNGLLIVTCDSCYDAYFLGLLQPFGGILTERCSEASPPTKPARGFNPTARPYCPKCGNGTTLVGKECRDCVNHVPRAYNIIPSEVAPKRIRIAAHHVTRITAERAVITDEINKESGEYIVRYVIQDIEADVTLADVQAYRFLWTDKIQLCSNGHAANYCHNYVQSPYRIAAHGYSPKRARLYSCIYRCKEALEPAD